MVECLNRIEKVMEENKILYGDDKGNVRRRKTGKLKRIKARKWMALHRLEKLRKGSARRHSRGKPASASKRKEITNGKQLGKKEGLQPPDSHPHMIYPKPQLQTPVFSMPHLTGRLTYVHRIPQIPHPRSSKNGEDKLFEKIDS